MELDREVIEQIEEVGGRELLDELFELFLRHTPARVEKIRRALADGGTEPAAKALHSLRSSCATIGALELAGSLGELERQAEAGELDRVAGAWPAVTTQLESVTEILAERLEKGEGREP